MKGLGWEEVCGDLLDRCEQLGLLTWHRFSVPLKQLGKRGPGGRFVAVYAAKAPPDLLRRKITLSLSPVPLMEAVRELAALAGLVVEPDDSGLLLRAVGGQP